MHNTSTRTESGVSHQFVDIDSQFVPTFVLRHQTGCGGSLESQFWADQSIMEEYGRSLDDGTSHEQAPPICCDTSRPMKYYHGPRNAGSLPHKSEHFALFLLSDDTAYKNGDRNSCRLCETMYTQILVLYECECTSCLYCIIMCFACSTSMI